MKASFWLSLVLACALAFPTVSFAAEAGKTATEKQQVKKAEKKSKAEKQNGEKAVKKEKKAAKKEAKKSKKAKAE